MAIRVAARLAKMVKAHHSAPTTGTDLVAVKNGHLAKLFEAHHPKVTKGKLTADVSDTTAALAGYRAGDRVQLNQGVEEDKGATQIEHRR